MTGLIRRVLVAATIAVVTACAASVPASTSAQAATQVQTATAAQTATAPPTTTPTNTPTQTTTPRVQTIAPSPAVSASAPPVIQSGTVTVEIGDNFYLPQTIIVTAGTRVLWVNRGQITHTASAHDKSFDSGNLEFGQTYERVFAAVGRNTYFCVQHEDMIGVVEVR